MENVIVQLPNIRNAASHTKLQCGCPVAKYMFITKYRIWHRKIRSHCKRDRHGTMEKYGIGVLTTDMKFYYSEFNNRLKDMKDQHIETLKKLLTSHYIIENQTRIAMTDNITRRNDAVGIFMDIVASAMDKRIIHVKPERLIKVINSYYTSVPNATVKDRNRIIDDLRKSGRYDFITDREWKIKYDLMSKTRQILFDDTILGILYLNASQSYSLRNKKYGLLRLIKNGIIIEENNKEENYEIK